MKSIIFFLLLFCICKFVFAQIYTINQGGTITTCSGTFYDSGGAGGDYSLGENYTITFCPSNPGQYIRLQFTSFDIDGTNNNVICFFDGIGTGGLSYGCNSNLDNLGLPFFVTSNDNASGCLTVTFNSENAIATGTGWSALIDCTFPCQQVFGILSSTNPPSQGGYVDICPGDSVTFSAIGNYPQNSLNYIQSDATSTFLWNFGDGTTATGQVVTHVFTNVQGYDVNLRITDIHGCNSSNDIGERVRVSTIPVFQGTDASPDTICLGSTSNLTGVVTGTLWTNIPQTVIAGTTFLPDGSGVSYQTSLNFDAFNPGQTLTNVNDIIQMCANMEHSYMGDLTITLTCPNGNFVNLLKYPNSGGSTYFGVPIDVDSDLNPGTGWTYCWAPTATFGDMNSHTGGTLPASPPNYNETGENGNTFESLVGCPLNGDWTITVTDNLNSDNGFIFWWGLDFDPALYPSAWSYTPTFQNNSINMNWSGNGIITPNGSTVTVQPDASGIHTYTFTATDNAGCSYDTSINIFVRPQSDPLCCIAPVANAGNDAIACNFSYQLNAVLNPVNTGMWYFVSGPGTALFSNPTQPDAIVSVDQYGSYTLRWKEVYNSACKDSDEVTIQFTSISFTTTFQDVTCNGFDNGRASVNVVPQYPPYTYSWSNGAVIPNLIGLPPGTIICTIRDSNGCDTTTSITIQEPFPFNITPSPDIYLCYGEWQFIYANPLGGIAPYDFFWNGVLDSASKYVGPLISTSYIVRAEDANGCVSDTFKINVYVDPPVQMQLIASDDTVCVGNPVMLNVIAWGGDGGPYYVYLNTGSLENPPFYVNPVQATEYIVTVMDKCGTYGVVDTVKIEIYPDPPIDFSADIYKGCQPLKVTFNEVNNNTGAWYSWVFGNLNENNSSFVKNPVHVFETPGIYDVTLTVTSKEGCTNTNTFDKMIEVYPKPDARFINEPQVESIVNPLVYFINYSTGAVNYYWSFGDGDSSEYINPQHFYNSVNTFNVSLIAESSERCKDTAITSILILDEYTFYAPTAFSPDKDGINDIFYVYGNGINPNVFQMYIFDRWGAIVFETKNINEGWNGILKNAKRNTIENGVYTWYVIYKDLSGVEHQKTGPVTLIH